jgi:hypothetical protein
VQIIFAKYKILMMLYRYTLQKTKASTLLKSASTTTLQKGAKEGQAYFCTLEQRRYLTTGMNINVLSKIYSYRMTISKARDAS